MDNTVERIATLEVRVEHNEEALKAMQKGCERTQREMRQELSKLDDTIRDTINNGVKDAVKDAVSDALKGSVSVNTHTGLTFNDKVIIVLITTLGGIVVAIITDIIGPLVTGALG